MITGGDLRQSRLDVGYKTFTISPWGVDTLWERARFRALEYECYFQLAAKTVDNCS